MKKLYSKIIFMCLVVSSCSTLEVANKVNKNTLKWDVTYSSNNEKLQIENNYNNEKEILQQDNYQPKIIIDVSQNKNTEIRNKEFILEKSKLITSNQNSIEKKNDIALEAFHKEELRTQIKNLQKVVKESTNNIKSVDGEGEEPKVHWAALTGMICGILGLLITPFLFATLGVIFGGIGLSKIKKNPEKYKGKGMAVTGLVTGIIAIVVVWAIVGLLLAAV
tara:strand:+ start:347 stop:1009 length:663 start_codon:yes stop_codon:yes gene_type:complete